MGSAPHGLSRAGDTRDRTATALSAPARIASAGNADKHAMRLGRFVVMLAVLSLTACGSKDKEKAASGNEKENEDKV